MRLPPFPNHRPVKTLFSWTSTEITLCNRLRADVDTIAVTSTKPDIKICNALNNTILLINFILENIFFIKIDYS